MKPILCLVLALLFSPALAASASTTTEVTRVYHAGAQYGAPLVDSPDVPLGVGGIVFPPNGQHPLSLQVADASLQPVGYVACVRDPGVEACEMWWSDGLQPLCSHAPLDLSSVPPEKEIVVSLDVGRVFSVTSACPWPATAGTVTLTYGG